MCLNDLPSHVRPIVQVIDDWFTNRRLGLIFEAKVSKGKLLVCGIDLQNGLAERPGARQMLLSLLEYMKGEEFAPGVKVPFGGLRGIFK